MAHENFKQSPIFHNALRCPDSMGNSSENHDGIRVLEATKRLDHLIRNALDLMDSGHLQPSIICAIKAFLRHIDYTLPGMAPRVRSDILHGIHERIAFCRELADAADRERLAMGWNDLSTAELFEERIARHQSTMHDVVYGNPFWKYHAGTSPHGGDAIYSGLGHNGKNFDFYIDMKHYWG